MFTVKIGKSFHFMRWSAESSLDVSFDKDHLSRYTDPNDAFTFGTKPKSFLTRIATVGIQIKSETTGRKPSTLEISLSISEARDLAEQLLKNAREAEVYINEIGQDG